MIKYLFIRSFNTPFSLKLREDFFEFNVDPHYDQFDATEYLYKSNQDEYHFNKISIALDDVSYKDCKGIIIDEGLGEKSWLRAIGLAGHIACTQYQKCGLNKLPIILTSWLKMELSEPHLNNFIISNLFQSKGIYMKTYDELFAPSSSIEPDKIRLDKLIVDLSGPNVSRFKVIPSIDDKHQSTNEWGAMRLAKNLGIFDSIKFSYPRHLYFKYLANFINVNNSPVDTSLHGLFSKVLLIDDNADHGWYEVIKLSLDCNVEFLSKKEDVVDKLQNNFTYFSTFDLIFLDLYLKKGETDISFSTDLLENIKTTYPDVPVIIFTASEKAISLHECLEHGADGMYIKESPVYYKDQDYSNYNVETFKKTVSEVSNKYKVLRPYWTKINEIFNNVAFQSIENSPRLIKDRIVERLRMFYGLLKKGYEQREYDKKTFFYSDYELAFMTLWSVFNEIQEFNFEKKNLEFPVFDIQGNRFDHHPKNIQSRAIRTTNCKWIYRKDNSVFFDFYVVLDSNGDPLNTKMGGSDSGFLDLKFHVGFKQVFNFDANLQKWTEVPPFFTVIPLAEKHKDVKVYQDKISFQIAFIIEKINPGTKTNYFRDLIELNKLRNSLYLTHGSNIDPAFYNNTEEAKRVHARITPSAKIADLFNLVYMLLTEDETNKLIIP